MIGVPPLILILALACSGPSARENALPPPVILISVDTLRADRLPAYGYRGVATPALDRLRSDSILFSNAYAPSPLTLPSHASMLSGLLPPSHGVRSNAGYRFDGSRHPSLPMLLKSKGYRTAAAVSTFVLRKETGLGPLFDFYDDAIPLQNDAVSFVRQQRSGAVAAAAVQRWIVANAAQPFFVFLHLYEPHTPYEPPEPFRSRFANAYDGEIAHADSIVGTVIDRLRALDLYDRSLIIFTSDHGEGLGDHGEDQHGILVYRESVRVPLIVKLPRSARKGTTVGGPVSLTDILPTVTEVVGIETPRTVRGTSLLATVKAGRAVYSESYFPFINLGWSPLRALRTSTHSFIEGTGPELYDLRTDPAELRDITTSERRILAAMRTELATYPSELQPVEHVDPDTAAKLAALGYIGSTRNRSNSGPLPNPRDAIRDLPRVAEAFRLADERRFDNAIAAMRDLLSRNPRFVDVWEKLAGTLAQAGRDEEAIAAYQAVIRQAPEMGAAMSIRIAEIHLRNGNLPQADSHGRVALTTHALESHSVLARVAAARRDFTAADAHIRAAMEAGGRQPATYVLLAQTLVQKNALQESLAATDTAASRARELGITKVQRLRFVRGDIFGRLNRTLEAKTEYVAAIAEYPHDMQAYANLAVLHAMGSDGTAFDRTLEQLIEANPGPAARELAARTAEAVGDQAGAARWRRTR